MPTLTLPGKPKPYIMAHRGNRILCPENTLAAFRRALEEGADILETDVHLSKDDVFMCIHDPTVDRTTNGQGRVDAMTLVELKQLSASYGRPEFADERIPTLEETLKILPPDVVLALELKTDRFLEPHVCRALVELLTQANRLERVVLLSFHMERVLAVRAVTPQIPIGYITMSNPLPNTEAQLFGPFFPLVFLNPFYAWMAHQRNCLAAPLDPTPDSRLWLYKLLGFDAVLTDDTGATLKALGRKR